MSEEFEEHLQCIAASETCVWLPAGGQVLLHKGIGGLSEKFVMRCRAGCPGAARARAAKLEAESRHD